MEESHADVDDNNGDVIMGVHETERLSVSQWHEMRRDAGEL